MRGEWTVGTRSSQSRDKTALLRNIQDTEPQVGEAESAILSIFVPLRRGERKASMERMRKTVALLLC